MKIQTNACVDRSFYSRSYRDGAFDEARAVLIGLYLEKELDQQKTHELMLHLDRCACCTQFLGDLEKIGDFQVARESFAYAMCPSSEAMDNYVFNRGILAPVDVQKMEKHLQECPLCKEEIDWLRNLEGEKVIPFRPPSRAWVSYMSAAAAVIFFLVASVLWWRQTRVALPENELRALAVIKNPEEIHFDSLERTSVVLSAESEKLYNRAVTLFRSHHFKDAAALFETVLKDSPRHSASLYLLGHTYYRLNEAEKAFQLCDRAEKIHPHTYERCVSLVHIALKTGHFDRALMEITVLYHEMPDSPEVQDLYRKITAISRGRTLKM